MEKKTQRKNKDRRVEMSVEGLKEDFAWHLRYSLAKGDERATDRDRYTAFANAVRDRLVEKVKEFNQFFIDLCDANLKDEFGIENNVLRLFESVLGDNLANYLTAGINTFLKGRYNPTDVVEDVPFFYPVIGVIRHNLLKNMRNDVISKFNQ